MTVRGKNVSRTYPYIHYYSDILPERCKPQMQTALGHVCCQSPNQPWTVPYPSSLPTGLFSLLLWIVLALIHSDPSFSLFYHVPTFLEYLLCHYYDLFRNLVPCDTSSSSSHDNLFLSGFLLQDFTALCVIVHVCKWGIYSPPGRSSSEKRILKVSSCSFCPVKHHLLAQQNTHADSRSVGVGHNMQNIVTSAQGLPLLFPRYKGPGFFLFFPPHL